MSNKTDAFDFNTDDKNILHKQQQSSVESFLCEDSFSVSPYSRSNSAASNISRRGHNGSGSNSTRIIFNKDQIEIDSAPGIFNSKNRLNFFISVLLHQFLLPIFILHKIFYYFAK